MRRLQAREPHAEACWVYDGDMLAARMRAFRDAFANTNVFAAYALKANGLPDLVERIASGGFGAEAGSLGELHLARACGVPAANIILNGNGRTKAEADFAAREGIRLVNVDLVDELDLLDASAAAASTTLRVALRVNPGIDTDGHPYVATGGDTAKFGMHPDDALEAWSERARWPHLKVDGVHVHVGSQLLNPEPLWRALDDVLALADASAQRGAALGLINVGGGLGVDYAGTGEAFPLTTHAERMRARAQGRAFDWIVEPGRWLVAPVGVLLARVLWVKRRTGRRFVVLGAGMNDLLRPALYGARHRIEVVSERPGAPEAATVVGPVCESADVFAAHAMLPPLERGDLIAIRDAGAYGASMSSNYNGRGRLPELIAEDGRVMLVRAGEPPEALVARRRTDVL